jgi:hypothetical protein
LASRSHVTVGEVFELIRDEAGTTMKNFAKYRAGKLKRKINVECKNSRERINEILSRREDKTLMQVLSAITDNLRYDQLN